MQIPGLPDSYTLRARLFPAILATAPFLALTAAWISWDGFSFSQAIAVIAIGVILWAFGEGARRLGKRVEPGIIERMGGWPSTTMLRYRDGTFPTEQKKRYLTYLGKQLGEKPPSESDEAGDPAAGDQYYRRAGDWLRNATADTKRFNILFEENVTYGFRRNLFSLKWWAIALNVTVALVVAIALIWLLPANSTVPIVQRFYVVLALAPVHAAYILLAATEAGVAQAARTYARQLILSLERLMPTRSRTLAHANDRGAQHLLRRAQS